MNNKFYRNQLKVSKSRLFFIFTKKCRCDFRIMDVSANISEMLLLLYNNLCLNITFCSLNFTCAGTTYMFRIITLQDHLFFIYVLC